MITLPVILVIVWLVLAIVVVTIYKLNGIPGFIKNLLTIAGSLAMFVAFYLLGWTTAITILASLSIFGCVFSLVTLFKLKSLISKS